MDDIIPRKKTLKRIIKGFTEDSDDDSNDTDTIKKNIIPPNDDLTGMIYLDYLYPCFNYNF